MLDSDPAEWTLWSPPVPIDLPNPKSALDGLTLQDGRHLLIYNHCHRGRTPLSVAIAEDDNFHWKPLGNLETAPGEYSYPAIIQTPAGEIHLVYSQRRRTIAHLQLGL